MTEQNKKMPDLLWSCFINWLNTIEKVLNKEQNQQENLKKQLGIE